MESKRQYNALDRVIMALDTVLQPTQGDAHPTDYPAATSDAPATANDGLTHRERRRVAGLMRVNHAGEIAAQGLYRGQAATARRPATRELLLRAAAEESAHLAWCRRRLRELGDHPSRLDPLWHFGSVVIGVANGVLGDRWSLGFVAETERQVEAHLASHLERLPTRDALSRQLLLRMQADEARHGTNATTAGARPLPRPVRAMMRRTARIMTTLSYWF